MLNKLNFFEVVGTHGMSRDDLTPDVAAALADRVERMIVVVEECTQLLMSTIQNSPYFIACVEAFHRV